MVEQILETGIRTSVVIDTGPDFRQQMINACVKTIHGVVLTHAHADHLHGIDDVRGFVFKNQHRMPIWADRKTMERVNQGFGYCFQTPIGSIYPPSARANIIEDLEQNFSVPGPGGSIEFLPLLQDHGDSQSLGFRIKNVAYCTDVSNFPAVTLAKMHDLDLLIIDCLQYNHHPSHLTLKQALGWITTIKPKRALLTHMNLPLDYDTVMRETPDHVEPAYDQMVVEYDVAV